MKSERQTNRPDEFFLLPHQQIDHQAQEDLPSTAGSCAVPKESRMLSNDIIGRVREYAQTVPVLYADLNISDGAKTEAISADQLASGEVADLNRGARTVRLRLAISEIRKFQEDFSTPLKPSDAAEIRHITWRISRYPDDWCESAWNKDPFMGVIGVQ